MLEAKHKMKLFFAVRPWEDEPDHAEWIDGEVEHPTTNATGFKCRIVRNETTGTLCGYVGVPKENRFWGIEYDSDSELRDISHNVHGGLTYSQQGDDGWWYFGFDTAHMDDFAPKVVEHIISLRGDLSVSGKGLKPFNYYDCMNYRTWEFVENEIHWLAWRLQKYDEYEKEEDDDA
jgi:hypothetical protein